MPLEVSGRGRIGINKGIVQILNDIWNDEFDELDIPFFRLLYKVISLV